MERVFDLDTAEPVLVDKFRVYELAEATTPTYLAGILSENHTKLHPRCRSLSYLRRDVRSNGLKSPLVLYFDDKGYFRVADGNHRLVVVKAIRGIETVPVVFVQVEDCQSIGPSVQWDCPVSLDAGQPYDSLIKNGAKYPINPVI